MLAAALAAASCAPPGRVRYGARLEEAPPAAAHAVHAERLAEVMRGLDRLVEQRLPQAMDVRLERERRARELAGVARAIAASAREIEASTPPTGDPAAGAEFAARARGLEQRATALAAAEALDPGEIQARVAALRDACAGCHARFRDGDKPPPAP